MSSAPATSTDATSTPAPVADVAWMCALLQAGDSFYPTGSYAHSFGLEGLALEGVVRDRETLRQFLLLFVIPALRQVDLPLAAHAYDAFTAADWTRIGELCALSAALKAPKELRLASENIGRQRAELVATLRNAALAQEFVRRAIDSGWPHAAPISAALEGRVLAAPVDAVLAGVYYSSVASVLSAAMKILRLGQNAAQSLLTEALAIAPATVCAAQSVAADDIGWFTPWLDIAAARHEHADARMFIS